MWTQIWPYFCSAEIKNWNNNNNGNSISETYVFKDVLFNGRLWLYFLCVYLVKLYLLKREKKNTHIKFETMRCIWARHATHNRCLPFRINDSFLSTAFVRFFLSIYFRVWRKRDKIASPVQKNSFFLPCERRYTVDKRRDFETQSQSRMLLTFFLPIKMF